MKKDKKNLNLKLQWGIDDILYKLYNFKSGKTDIIAARVLSIVDKHIQQQKLPTNLYKAMDQYFSSTNMSGKPSDHSLWGFTHYVHNNYAYCILPKKYLWIVKILVKLLR